jgi:hypothetical protein
MNALDEELIQRLRVELDALTADVSSTAPPFELSVGVARVVTMPRHYDRRQALVLAAAMVALIATVAALVAVSRDGSAVGSTDTSPDTASVITVGAVPVAAHPIPASPEGWDLLDWGNVRLSLPPEMSPFHTGNGCTTDPGTDLEITCGDESVRISTASTNAATDQIVNGLHVSWQAGECAGCQMMVLPELATTVTVHRHDDAAANAILDTVGPSGSWRFQFEIRPTSPADWKTVNFEGVSIRVPPDWPVQTVTKSESSPCPQALIPNAVVLDSGTPGDCNGPALLAPNDGVRLLVTKAPIDTRPGWPEWVVGSERGGLTFVVAEVGFGADPSIAPAILSSFADAPTDTSNTYATVPTPVPTPVDLSYFAVGESVMLGAEPDLDAHGVTTVAEVSKGPDWTLQQLQLAKTKYHITHGVVIQLGTNGTVTREQYDAILDEFSDLNLVVVMTVKAPKPWIDGNNAIIRSLPLTHPNVKILDWEARSAEIADHLSQSDGGIHLSDDVSKAFYTNLILEALGLPT